MVKEIWKVVPGFDDRFIVSNKGNVKSSLNGEFYTKRLVKGYEKINTRIKGKTYNLFVHRLVAFAFIENIKNKPFINHIDCNKSNNNVENLEWCTAKENRDHAKENGLIPKINANINGKLQGSKNWNSLLTEELVQMIRINCDELGGNLKKSEIAKALGLSHSTISDVVKFRSWKHVPFELNFTAY